MKNLKRYSILGLVLSLCLLFAVYSCKTGKPEVSPGTEYNPPNPSPPPVAALKVGDTAPDFTLQTINGETVKLSELRGKIVMINIWWSECEGCVEEAPYIQKAFNKLPSQQWVILTINAWDTDVALRHFIDANKLTFPVLIDPEKQLNEAYLKYGVPTTFFVDGNGVIREIRNEIFASPEEIEATFTSLQKYNIGG
jgi:peroxiredoxin